MGALARARGGAGVLLAVLLFGLTVATPLPTTGNGEAPAVEEVRGAGVGSRLACIGCVGLAVYLGLSTPLLMIYYAVKYAPMTEACSLACIQAVT